MTPELEIRERLASCNQGRARFHRLIDSLKGKRIFPTEAHLNSLVGLQARRKIISDFLNKPVEDMNQLLPEQWNKVNEAIALHFGIK